MTIQRQRWEFAGGVTNLPATDRSKIMVARLLLSVVAACGTVASASSFVLDLPGEGVLPGDFVATAGAGSEELLQWRSPVFAVPFEFRLSGIVGIRSLAAGPDAETVPEGFRCRLLGGDSIDGELVAIDTERVILRPAGSREEVRIPRPLVISLARSALGQSAGYVGPAGLNGWDQQPASSWRDEAGRIGSDQRNASVSRDVGGAARARYDLTLSWQQRPDLVLSVAVGDDDGTDSYRFEMLSLDDDLPVAIVVRQEDERGDIEEVAIADPEQGRLRLSLFVDQSAGRLAVLVADAREVVDLTLPPAAAKKRGSRLRLTVRAGDVCLESLRVTDWTEPEPLAGAPMVSQVITKTGAILEGQIDSFEAAGGLVVVAKTGRETLPLAEVQELRFPEAAVEPESGRAGPPPSVRLVRWGGSVISGQLLAVTDAAVRIGRAGIEDPVTVPLADLRSLASLRVGEPAELPGRPGRLIMAGVNLPGCLASGDPAAEGLTWQPQGSLTASGFSSPSQPELSALIEYVPAEVKREDSPAGMVDVGGIGGAVNQDEHDSFVITMLAEEGAAARDGRIEPGDRILAVRPLADAGFVETRGLDLQTVMNLLRGRVGTPVSLKIQPAVGGEPVQYDLVRGLIYVASGDVLDQALAAHARFTTRHAAVAGGAGFPALLILRSGDVAAAVIESIDQEGVRLRSPVTASGGRTAVTVAHRLMQALEFDPAAASRPLDRAQWERLLTLPRAQRNNPPTHLLRLRSGDYVRGHLESLTADTLEFRVVGQRKQLPREAVVRMIWLHPEDLNLEGTPPAEGEVEETAQGAGAAEVVAPADPGGMAGLIVQGVAAGGERTTLVADRVEGESVVGMSPAFGPSRIDTKRIDRLLVGKAVAAADEELPYSRWQLRLAPQPRALQEEPE